MKKFKDFYKNEILKTFVKPKIGEEILHGKFKNKKDEIIGYGINKNNQPTVILDKAGEKPLFNFRMKKLMDKEDE
jgi:tRNA(His) 5'-end guanylyltransferase